MANNERLKEKRYVGVKETVIYGVANGGQVIGYNMVRMQLTFFLVTVFGIPSTAVATMITVMGIWDALNDPLMGTLVDKTRTNLGKLRPYLLFVPIPLGIATVVFFGGAEFLAGVQSTTLKIVYMCVTYFIWEFFYTIGDIPFWGLSAAISPNPVDRSNAITSARFLSGIIGGIATPVISLLIDLSNKGVIGINMRQLFLVMGIVAGTVGMGLFSLSGIFCRERVVQNSDEPKVLDCFRFLFKNKPLLLIVCSNILATVGGVTDTFAQYFYIFSLGAASWGTIIGIPGVISGFLTYLLLPALERRWTSKQIVVRTTILKALVGTTTFLIGMKFYRNPAVIVPLLMIQGFIFSSLTSINMVVPTKMIGDTVDYMEWKTGERNEGMAFSLLTFISKLTGSLCTAIATAIIPVIGLVTVQLADNSLQLVENPQINTRFWLWALVTILPPVASLISLIPYRFYDLEGKKLKDIQEEMIARRELNSKTISKSEGEI